MPSLRARQILRFALPRKLRALLRRAAEHILDPSDLDDSELSGWRAIESFTMTTPERIHALRLAVRFVVANNLPGAIVECGVWRGGSMMAVAQELVAAGARRDLYLFDTFEGMTNPGPEDHSLTGESAASLLKKSSKADSSGIWCIAGEEDVRKNLASTGCDMDSVFLMKGPVEQTLWGTLPDKISILRLDTDWYQSTKLELEVLYPRLVPGGVLIIDDYGYWRGARQAVDEYFELHPPRPLLVRIDSTGRIGIKPTIQ